MHSSSCFLRPSFVPWKTESYRHEGSRAALAYHQTCQTAVALSAHDRAGFGPSPHLCFPWHAPLGECGGHANLRRSHYPAKSSGPHQRYNARWFTSSRHSSPIRACAWLDQTISHGSDSPWPDLRDLWPPRGFLGPPVDVPRAHKRARANHQRAPLNLAHERFAMMHVTDTALRSWVVLRCGALFRVWPIPCRCAPQAKRLMVGLATAPAASATSFDDRTTIFSPTPPSSSLEARAG
jgi:hypothetical protein